jgi:hypothetical protein
MSSNLIPPPTTKRKEQYHQRQNKSKKPHLVSLLTPVILAAQEAEIRMMAVRGQPRQIVQETLSQKKSQI